jgi:ABC-type Fe3+/spermidine/putrescine transport system ATPase subunit
MSERALAAIEVLGLKAGYGDTVILHGVDLSVASGEFIAILGSSGCGKTTLLRSIAGFQPVRAGAIRLNGVDVAGLPPEKRGIAMVFQSYALWPHMSVLGNIGYGLRLRGMKRDEIHARVESILALLGLSGLIERKVTDLSGGQRQRVALGRALAVEPKLLLLDEPLSNLDAKVRLSLRYEIKALQKKLGFAAIHVTHDREEAMTMADRIVIMDKGHIAQIGTPEAVYDHPVSPFVASFMGAENRIELDVTPDGASSAIRRKGAQEAVFWQGTIPAGDVVAYFRDDVARLGAPDTAPEGEIVLPGTIVSRAYPGGHYRYAVDIDGRHFAVTDDGFHEPGTRVGLRLPLADLHIFSAEQGPS